MFRMTQWEVTATGPLVDIGRLRSDRGDSLMLRDASPPTPWMHRLWEKPRP